MSDSRRVFVAPGQPGTGGDVDDEAPCTSCTSFLVPPLLLLEQRAAEEDSVKVDLDQSVKTIFMIRLH